MKTLMAGGIAALAAVLLAPGAVAQDTQSPIQHLVVIFQENRSFDDYFGTYPHAPGFLALPDTPNANGIPAGSFNLDESGRKVAPFLFSEKELQTVDVNHGYDAMLMAVNGGKMDGFYRASEKHTKTSGRIAMGYYDYHALPAYWQYAQHFALADNWFQPVFGPSTPGALYLVAAQSGTADNPIKGDPTPAFGPLGGDQYGPRWPALDYPNIGDRLTQKGVSWAWYQGGYAAQDDSYSAHHNPFQYFVNYDKGAYKDHLKDTVDLQKDLDTHQLPAVVFVKGAYGDDEHPGLGNQSTPTAEDFSVKIINAIMKSDAWKNTAIIIAYDESGGYWDHQSPPVTVPGPDGLKGDGPRIPVIIISPYSKTNYIGHGEYDTTSILKFIEWNWGVDALNNRDRAANNVLDLFDFKNPTMAPYQYPVEKVRQNAMGTAAVVLFNNGLLAQTVAGDGAFYGADSQVMVPLADLARNLNAESSYDGSTMTQTIRYNGHTAAFKLESTQATVDGKAIALTRPTLLNKAGRGFVAFSDLRLFPGLQVSEENGTPAILTK